MPTVPETGAAHDALLHLVDQLRAALADPPSPRACRELLLELNAVGELGDWCRTAGLGIARGTTPPLTWQEMQALLHISDSTLHDRFRRWAETEGGA